MVFGRTLDAQISIHAPLRGRRNRWTMLPPRQKFQSTPPCGGDHHDGQGGKAAQDFNPRPLAGATMFAQACTRLTIISIHAPLRGRLYEKCHLHPGHHFNPRPLAGATKMAIGAFLRKKNFNPRPLAGATHRPGGRHPGCLISIHAPLRGRRAFRPAQLVQI